MGKPHPLELRERVVAFVDEGHTHRAAAVHFRVSPRLANDMIILRRQTGSLVPKPQGHGGKVGKLRDQHEWVRQRLADNGDLTLDDLVVELVERGVRVHRSAVGKLLNRLGLSHKKICSPVKPTGLISRPNGTCGSTAGGHSSTGPYHDWSSLMRRRQTRN